jgi:hypothetical protein
MPAGQALVSGRSACSRLAPNHQPQVDLNMAVSDLKQGLEAMKFSDPGFRNSSYMRLKVLSVLRDKGLLNERLEWVQAKAARQAA